MVETGTCVEGHVFTHIVGWVPEHLKHPLKMIGWYWSLASNCGQTTGIWMGLHCPLHTWYIRANEVMFQFLFSLILMVLDGGWPCIDRAHHYGKQPSGLLLRRSFFLGLRVCLAEQWLSTEALSNQLPQVIYQSMCHCVEPAP